MKISWLLALLLLPLVCSGQSAGEVLRIKIEWLNAKECGIEGCKPQSVVIKSGSSIGFGWPEMPERGLFEMRPLLRENFVTLDLKRLKTSNGHPPSVVSSKSANVPVGQPTDIAIDELDWRITATLDSDETKE